MVSMSKVIILTCFSIVIGRRLLDWCVTSTKQLDQIPTSFENGKNHVVNWLFLVDLDVQLWNWIIHAKCNVSFFFSLPISQWIKFISKNYFALNWMQIELKKKNSKKS